MTSPHPRVLADRLEQLVKLLRSDGARALELAEIYAADGWPSSTMGDGGSRSTDPTSITERAALAGYVVNEDDTGSFRERQFEGLDRKLQAQIRTLWLVSGACYADVQSVTSHASDDDQLPAGSGTCECCGRVVRSDVKVGDRLRAGFCESDYRAWDRAGRPDRFEWVRSRRLTLRKAS